MNRFLMLVTFAFCVAACQTNEQKDGVENEAPREEAFDEEAYERAEPQTGNENKPEPVVAKYLEAAFCDSMQQTITYTQHVKQIVDTRCAVSACHDATSKENGIDMTGYANARHVFEHGKGLCSITHDFEARCKHMPTVRIKLPDREIAQILCWAQTGYAE